MKIGIDCRLWDETGVGRYTRNLVKELSLIDEENEYVLFILPQDREAISQITNSSPHDEVGKWKIVEANVRWHTIAEQFDFPKVLYKENLDLVHFPYFSVPLLYNRPFVVTIHDLIINHFPTGQASTLPYPLYWLKLQGYKFVISQAAQKAQKVIAVSNATKKEIVNHLHTDPHRIVVTYEGIDEALRVSNYKYTGIPSLKHYFLYVGNAYPHKNLGKLIAAFELAKKQDPQIKLVLVGKNDFFYDRLQREMVDENIIFFGEANDEALSSLYQHALALVAPSLMEGFGLPPLEAMANNCLVLTSRIPVFQEICNNAAIYFDPLDISDMSEKMLSVLTIEKKQKEVFKKRGQERVDLFSWKKMAEETLKIYNHCLK